MMDLFKAMVAFLAFSAASGNSIAGIVTWNILTDYQGVTGNITFDDAPITGLADGDYDPSDTHINNATVNLSSSILGIDITQTGVLFQPLTNTFDNKHIDSTISLGNGTSLRFFPNSDSGSPAVGVSEYWLDVIEPGASYTSGQYKWAFTDDAGVNFDTNLAGNVPVPAPLALLSLGLVGLGFTRRRIR